MCMLGEWFDSITQRSLEGTLRFQRVLLFRARGVPKSKDLALRRSRKIRGAPNVLLTSSSKGPLIPLGRHRTTEAVEQLAKEHERCSREVSVNTSSIPGTLSDPPSQWVCVCCP